MIITKIGYNCSYLIMQNNEANFFLNLKLKKNSAPKLIFSQVQGVSQKKKKYFCIFGEIFFT
jgi:hypothetical protein